MEPGGSARIGEPALVGRRAELGRVADALADPARCGVALLGAAGCGKSRLATECLQVAGDLGFETRRVLATASTRDTPLASMAPLLPPLGAEVNPLGAAFAALRASSPVSARMLLLVDDAQWMDDTSAGLVQQVLADGGAFALMTIRTGEQLPHAVGRLLRDDRMARIELGPLSRAELVDLLVSAVEGDVEPGALQRLADLADGSPLIARELAAGAIESGALVVRGGRWQLVGDLTGSTRVGELVADRVGRQEEEGRRALGMVALAEPLPLDWIAAERIPRFEGLEAAGLLRAEERTGRAVLTMAHPLYGEVLRSRMTPLQRRATLLDLVAMATASGCTDDHDRLRLVAWSRQIGRPVPGADLRSAAQRAFAVHRFELATELLGAVPADERTGRYRMQYANALSWTRRHAEVDEIVDEILREPTDDHELAEAVHFQAFRWQAGGDFDGADRLMRQALERVEDPGAAQLLAVGVEGNSIGLLGPTEAIARVQPLIGALSGSLAVTAGHILSLALLLHGRPEAATEVAERAHVVHRAVWLEEPVAMFPSHPSTSLQVETLARAVAGQVGPALDLVGEGEELEPDLSSGSVTGMLAMAAGYARWLAGDLGAAVRQFELALRRWEGEPHEHGPRWRFVAIMGSVSAAQVGDEARAADLLRRAESGRPSVLIDPALPSARAWTAVAGHRIGDAAAELGEGVRAALEAEARLFAIDQAFSLFRLGAADRVPPEVLELRPDLDGALLPARLDVLDAAMGDDADRLHDAGARLEAMGVAVEAAEVFAAASRLWERTGDRRRATAAGRRARGLLERVPEVRTPGLVLPVAPTPLTDREREIAALAADGTPAKVIAERLYISQRTVTNHLQRVYDKLGVSSRAELGAALGRGE